MHIVTADFDLSSAIVRQPRHVAEISLGDDRGVLIETDPSLGVSTVRFWGVERPENTYVPQKRTLELNRAEVPMLIALLQEAQQYLDAEALESGRAP